LLPAGVRLPDRDAFAGCTSSGLSVALLFGFGLLMGLALAPTLVYYAGADPQAVWPAVAGFTMVGFRRLRRSTALDSAPLIAASIFLDVLNVFLFFVQIFGRTRD
jgi:FtsH-binding integral membrane protein